MQTFLKDLSRRPVIASARDLSQVRRAAGADVAAVFLLGGTILTLRELAEGVRAGGKRVFIHLDLLGGLGRDAAAVEWCAREIRPDGMISTRGPLLKRAGELGMITIQRLFVMDSSGMLNGLNMLRAYTPDMLEVLPGLVPKAITRLKQQTGLSIIAGGMITRMDEVAQALEAGAVGISTSEESLWNP